jgi:hypothetical protein
MHELGHPVKAQSLKLGIKYRADEKQTPARVFLIEH